MCARSFDTIDRDSLTLSSRLDEEGLYDFLCSQLPQLEKLGEVRATDAVHSSAVRRLPRLKVGVSVNGGQLLLNLEGGDLTQDELDELLSAYSRKKRFHRLRSGAFYSFEDREDDTWDTLS